jgi:hypothetical protein
MVRVAYLSIVRYDRFQRVECPDSSAMDHQGPYGTFQRIVCGCGLDMSQGTPSFLARHPSNRYAAYLALDQKGQVQPSGLSSSMEVTSTRMRRSRNAASSMSSRVCSLYSR